MVMASTESQISSSKPFANAHVVIPSGGGKSFLSAYLNLRGWRAFDIDWLWTDTTLTSLKKARTSPGGDRSDYGPENRRVELMLAKHTLYPAWHVLFTHHPGEIGSHAETMPTLIVLPARHLILDNLEWRGDKRSQADQLLNRDHIVRRSVDLRANERLIATSTNEETMRVVLDFVLRHNNAKMPPH